MSDLLHKLVMEFKKYPQTQMPDSLPHQP